MNEVKTRKPQIQDLVALRSSLGYISEISGRSVAIVVDKVPQVVLDFANAVWVEGQWILYKEFPTYKLVCIEKLQWSAGEVAYTTWGKLRLVNRGQCIEVILDYPDDPFVIGKVNFEDCNNLLEIAYHNARKLAQNFYEKKVSENLKEMKSQEMLSRIAGESISPYETAYDPRTYEIRELVEI